MSDIDGACSLSPTTTDSMKLNSPLPQPLSSECIKAAKILKSFVDGGNNGLDGVIPRTVLQHAKGFAIFTIFKAGFIFSARGGSGVVVAKLDDGSWSAPSAIGTAGLGVGTQAGAEVTDFLVILNSKSAVRSFMAAGSLTLGGNMSIAIGPLGRNGEATGAVNAHGKLAAMYSYSKTRGLFGGMSLEGSAIVERQDANALAYKSPVTVKMLLGGMVEVPDWATPLIKTLDACAGMPRTRDWIHDERSSSANSYSFGEGPRGTSPEPSRSSFLRKKKKPQFPPASWGTPSQTGSYFSDEPQLDSLATSSASQAGFETQFDSNYNPIPAFASKARIHDDSIPAYNEDPLVASAASRTAHSGSTSLFTPIARAHTRTSSYAEPNLMGFDEEDLFNNTGSTHPQTFIHSQSELAKPFTSSDGVGRAIALYKFDASEPGDLSFHKGDVITIIKKSNSTDDWWTGKLQGHQGIFPANFVELV